MAYRHLLRRLEPTHLYYGLLPYTPPPQSYNIYIMVCRRIPRHRSHTTIILWFAAVYSATAVIQHLYYGLPPYTPPPQSYNIYIMVCRRILLRRGHSNIHFIFCRLLLRQGHGCVTSTARRPTRPFILNIVSKVYRVVSCSIELESLKPIKSSRLSRLEENRPSWNLCFPPPLCDSFGHPRPPFIIPTYPTSCPFIMYVCHVICTQISRSFFKESYGLPYTYYMDYSYVGCM